MRNLKQIDFNEALDRARSGERVYAVDLSAENKLTMKLFNRLEIADALRSDYTYMIAEEVQE